MKKREEKRNFRNDEADELDIEVLTEIQGGVKNEAEKSKDDCGLGCFVGSGSGLPDKSGNK